MCDYSLMLYQPAAQEGEELVMHGFPPAPGLASPADLKRLQLRCPLRKLSCPLKDLFSPPESWSVCAVCIPPGARLQLQGIPARLQRQYGVGTMEPSRSRRFPRRNIAIATPSAS